jgi:hypothetical protein
MAATSSGSRCASTSAARACSAKRERVAGLVRAFFDDQLQVARPPQRGEHGNRFDTTEPGDEMRREPSARNRRVEQHVAIAFRQRDESLVHRDPNAGRHADGVAATVVPLQRAAQQLFGQQRPAFGQLADALERRRGQVARDVAQRRVQQPIDLVVAQRLDRDRLAAVPFQAGQSAHAIGFERFVDAVSRDKGDRLRRQTVRQVAQQFDRSAAGPMHVFEHDDQAGRVGASDPRERLGDGREPPPFLAALGAGVLAREVGLGAQRRERFDDRRVRRIGILRRSRYDRAQSVARRARDQLGDEPRLADAGFTAQHEQCRTPRLAAPYAGDQTIQLAAPPDELTAKNTRGEHGAAPVRRRAGGRMVRGSTSRTSAPCLKIAIPTPSKSAACRASRKSRPQGTAATKRTKKRRSRRPNVAGGERMRCAAR